jgi:hypothetical protein
MTTKQENFIRMVRAVNKVLQDNQPKWASVKRFVQSANELNNLLSLVGIVGAKANSPITGATKDKYAIEETAIEEGVNIAKFASIYALDKKNLELHDKLRLSRSMLLRLHEDECFKRLTDVFMQLEPVKGELADYGILPADIAHFKTSVDAYEHCLAKPRQLTVERKTMNVTLLPELISKMRMVLYELDSMIGRFNITSLPTAYKNARLVLDLGSRREDEDGDDEKPEPPVA